MWTRIWGRIGQDDRLLSLWTHRWAPTWMKLRSWTAFPGALLPPLRSFAPMFVGVLTKVLCNKCDDPENKIMGTKKPKTQKPTLGSLLSNINQNLHFQKNGNYVLENYMRLFLFVINFAYFPLLHLQFAIMSL